MSGSGDESSFSGVSSPFMRADRDNPATFGTDLEKNLGTGSEEGAGEAWNVGPAYACSLAAGVPKSMLPPSEAGCCLCSLTLSK